jgi:hypothetical protein
MGPDWTRIRARSRVPRVPWIERALPGKSAHRRRGQADAQAGSRASGCICSAPRMMRTRSSTCWFQRRPDTCAAVRPMRKLLKKQGFVPKLLVTDKLRSYASAFRQLGLSCPHEQWIRRNNRAENSHQPVRRRERKAIQVASLRAALPEYARRRPQYLQSSTPSRLPDQKWVCHWAATELGVRNLHRYWPTPVRRLRAAAMVF